jgi:uncharacterized protein (TIGR04222 family)
MNPFNLPGPEFLVFYLLLAFAVHLAWRPLVRLFGEKTDDRDVPAGRFDLANLDPYLIAYLRGGEPETARVVIVSLLDRGLLTADGDQLQAAPGAAAKAARPIERVVLQAFATGDQASDIFKDAAFKTACTAIANELEQLGLLANAHARGRIALMRGLAIALLVGVAFLKISVAIERGHHNIGFLVLIAIVATIVMIKRSAPRRTRSGDGLLEDLKLRFHRLEKRAEDISLGGASRELVILAAVFGIAALPAVMHAQMGTLFPLGMRSASAGSSCGSSCGSSSSSCGGSSCGGGGCGGGCGGCG